MPRVLVVLPTQTYRANDFIRAGEELGVELIVASEADAPIDMGDRYLRIDCADPEGAAQLIVEAGDRMAIDGVVAADDGGVVVAAIAGQRLGLAANPPEAAAAARDKGKQREMFGTSEVPQPRWSYLQPHDDALVIGEGIGYPIVVKPLDRSAGQGVIRVDIPDQLNGAIAKVHQITGEEEKPLILEELVEGDEVAVEGIIGPAGLMPLAIFDKPAPVEGEGFQETILVTPSRLPPPRQRECLRVAAQAVNALGLTHGSVHIEMIATSGPVVVLEVAARSIGGLCSKSLKFGLMDTSLETLILRNALGRDKPELRRGPGASGVLMIPIPKAGTFQAIEGLDSVKRLEGVTSIDVTVRAGDTVAPPPVGDKYLGFVFANAPTPDRVEATLVEAREVLDVRIAPNENGGAA
jgi:biotin carboxylase